MVNYVNEEAFFRWYESVTGKTKYDRQELLDDVVRQYNKTRRESYDLPAARTATGKAESYPIRFENIGCCGACTPFLYF